jgi:hypothetical protein
MGIRKRKKLDGARPVETDGVVKMWKTEKHRFPHFHNALENSSRITCGPSFPQFPQGLLLGSSLDRKKQKPPSMVSIQ